MKRAVIVMREQKKSPAEKFAELLEWMDDFAFYHPGHLMLFNIIVITITIVCTYLNLTRR